MDKKSFSQVFSIGEVVWSGGNRTQIEILEIGDQYIKIRPTKSKNRKPHNLSYEKIAATISGFLTIDPKRIVPTFQKVLTARGVPKDHTNEAYLYGIAREFLDRRDVLPEELFETRTKPIFEGAKKQIVVNSYERDQEARLECLRTHGYVCAVCNFDFQKAYGPLGEEFIHVHHLKPLSDIGKEYKVNPAEDLCPVCPNCHAMLHRQRPPLLISELKSLLNFELKYSAQISETPTTT